jgi:hypothetical protein
MISLGLDRSMTTMTRRDALRAGVAAAAAFARTPSEASHFQLDRYRLHSASEARSVGAWLRDQSLAEEARHVAGSSLVLEALVAAHRPQYVVLRRLNSNSARSSAVASLQPDSREWLVAPSQSADSWCFDRPLGSRIVELRVYHSPEWQALSWLHRHMAIPGGIFHGAGIRPLLAARNEEGESLVYLCPFDSLTTREAAWGKLNADPDWIATQDESEQRFGHPISTRELSLFRADEYSRAG